MSLSYLPLVHYIVELGMKAKHSYLSTIINEFRVLTWGRAAGGASASTGSITMSYIIKKVSTGTQGHTL